VMFLVLTGAITRAVAAESSPACSRQPVPQYG
jgi:hypothetical protein